MTDEKWFDLKDNLAGKFSLTEENEEQITKDDVGNEIINRIERLIFDNDGGKFKIERVTRPVILDKKVHYSHTAGNKGLVEYILSPDEFSHKVHVYREINGSWEELSVGTEGLRF